MADTDSELTRPRHLQWEALEERLRQPAPSREVLDGQPRVELFVDASGSRLGIRIFAVPRELPISPMAEITIRKVRAGLSEAVEVAACAPDLFRDFYAFCCTVADRVQFEHQDASVALEATLRAWSALLRPVSVLSLERQVGLLGELWFLRRAARAMGWSAALACWRGPDSEEHDFALPEVDVEVKTTLEEARVHSIGSLTQLAPKPGRPLTLLSLQFTPGPPGDDAETLAEAVEECTVSLTASEPDRIVLLRERLGACGFKDEHAMYYHSRYRLRSVPMAVAVDSAFPAIVPSILSGLGDRLGRIESVAYRANVTGLGVAEDSEAFSALLFRPRKGRRL